MISTLYGSENSYPNNTTTQYIWVTSSLLGSWNANQNNRDQRMPGSFTLSELYVLLDTAPTAGKSWQFDLMKNGSTTGVTVTIADAAVTATDSVNSIAYAAGDTISLRAVPTNTPTTGTNVWWNIKCSGTGTPILGGNASAMSNSADNFTAPNSVWNLWGTTNASREILIPCAGTFSNFYVGLDASPSAGKSYDITLLKNGSATTVTVNIADANTTGSDTTHSFSVVAGDTICLQTHPVSTPTARQVDWGFVFTPTTDGESFMSYGSAAAPSTAATRFEQPLGGGGNSWNATERQVVIGDYDITKQYVKLDAASGAAKSWDVTLRNNAADTALTTNLADTTTGNTTATVSPAQGDKLAIELTPNGTPTAFTAMSWGAVIFVDPGGLTISPSDSALALSMDNTTITQNHVIASVDSALALTMDNATITQNHVIVPQDISLGLSEDNTTVNHNHVLPVDDIALALTEDSTTISQNHVVASLDIALALTEDNATITQTNFVLTAQDITLSLTEDNTTITQNHIVSVNDIALGLTTDNTTVAEETDVVLSTNDIALGLTTDNSTINQNHSLTTADISLALSEDNTTITQNHVVVSADLALTLTEDPTTIAQTHDLAVQDLSLALGIDSTTITQNHIIVADDLALALALDLATILRYDVVVIPGGSATPATWVAGGVESVTHSAGSSVSAATWSAGSTPSVAVIAGGAVDSSSWVPGDMV